MPISIGIGAGIPFGSSSPFSELTSLVRSLGGYIFVPGTETYADRLNITGAESALDSQVGYVGNAAGANYAYQDTLADTPKLRGRVTNWSKSSNNFTQYWADTSCTRTINTLTRATTVGNSYVNQGIVNTGLASAPPVGVPIAIQVKAKAKSLGGFLGFRVQSTFPDRADILFNLTTGALVGTAVTNYTILSTSSELQADGYWLLKVVVTPTASVLTQLIMSPGDNSTAVSALSAAQPTLSDCYVKDLQTEVASSCGVFVPTNGAEASTGAPTTLEFDGSTDHLITDIVPGVNGYWGAVVRQDEALGVTNCILGCGTLAGNIAGVAIQINASGNATLTRYNTSGTNGTATTSTAITAGVMAIIDGDWTVTASRVRINGAGEGTGTSSIDVTGSTSIALIAAKNTAKDGAVTAVNFLQGKEGIVWMVPATVQDATQARIRQLAGQIYGVSTL